ncbi:hypothetical protein KIH87_08210 [Paraneptunicella aestuarii]|uniref:hypothetical protein n=1 Tax=Paraneptunicella aestuarii TaxID=2831148 RepID=UPI001E33A5D7|nr:hypothetical protein [Paraneptunicella aestuarii]UAA40306.1 hypothetical protein KIH87_08210 [Paraneptunicella aestuarii]
MNRLFWFSGLMALCVLLTACESSSTLSQGDDAGREIANEKPVKKNSQRKLSAMGNEFSLLINKGKFRYGGGELHAGDRVFDVQLNQWAVATGEIVVVLHEDNEGILRQYFEAHSQPVSYHKLANAIYGLRFDKSQDLLVHYQVLQQNQSVKQLELQLRYDGNSGDKATRESM